MRFIRPEIVKIHGQRIGPARHVQFKVAAEGQVLLLLLSGGESPVAVDVTRREDYEFISRIVESVREFATLYFLDEGISRDNLESKH